MPSTGPRWTADRQASPTTIGGPLEAAALGTPAAHRHEARTEHQPTGEGQERDCPRRRQSPRRFDGSLNADVAAMRRACSLQPEQRTLADAGVATRV